MFVNLLTRKQTLQVYAFAGVTADKLPKRHWQVSIFPSPLDSKIHFQIRRTSFSATYGGKLFEITHVVGWPLCQCTKCGRKNYCEPHGTTAACKCSKDWTEHVNVPYGTPGVSNQ